MKNIDTLLNNISETRNELLNHSIYSKLKSEDAIAIASSDFSFEYIEWLRSSFLVSDILFKRVSIFFISGLQNYIITEIIHSLNQKLCN